jgi:dimethylhistidine N-methyltransferase
MTVPTRSLRRTPAQPAPLLDLHPREESFRAAVLRGLARRPRTLEPKWFYDRRGSELFERITGLPTYYPTRTELGILRAAARELALLLGPRVALVEYGSGSSAKVRLLLDALREPLAYVPIDISREFLWAASEALAADYPDLLVAPVCADWSRSVALPPAATAGARRRVVFFPGSTIGNLHPAAAERLLRGAARLAGRGGGLLVGVDTPKERAVLEAAYDDPQGVTADFNRNLLARINRELGGTFDLARFRHRAVWNEAPATGAPRVEMHLESRCDQTAAVAGRAFRFAAGETIHTECSYKYDVATFQALAARAGFAPRRVWTDPAGWFSVHWLHVAG